MPRLRILYIEPFEGGSHATFTRRLQEGVDADWTTLTLPGRHWKWRARGAAVYFALANKEVLSHEYDLLWASSFLNLADLLALCPNLQMIPRVLYFHENQLAYPIRPEFARESDSYFGLSQMVSCLVATHCVFNSEWNRDSFLSEGARLLSRMPDRKPPGWIGQIREKSSVLPVPLKLPELANVDAKFSGEERSQGPIVLWNHRWEHDKDPEAFFETLIRLKQDGVPFRLIVCGERYRRVPPIFETAQQALADRIVHWGFLESRAEYDRCLASAHLVVSTARHEFFGISMVEATHLGARPVVPNRLSYPEIFPAEYRYETIEDLPDVLTRLIEHWVDGGLLRGDYSHLSAPFGEPLLERYASFMKSVTALYPAS